MKPEETELGGQGGVERRRDQKKGRGWEVGGGAGERGKSVCRLGGGWGRRAGCSQGSRTSTIEHVGKLETRAAKNQVDSLIRLV